MPETPVPDFDADTAVTALGGGRFGTTLLETWNIVEGPNGGYLAAIIARAMTETVAEASRGLRSLTVHYLTRPEFSDAEVRVDVMRTGRSLSTLTATLTQRDRTICTATAAFSVPWTSTTQWHAEMPAWAHKEGVDIRNRPKPVHVRNWTGEPIVDAPFFSGEGTPRLGQWIRAAKPRPLDAIELVAIADASPPSGFPRMSQRSAMPTIDLTVHIRATFPLDPAPVDDRVYAEFTTAHVADGFAGEDGTMWSADGRLLAESRQLAITR